MVHRHISIAESYSVLGLSEDASLDVVRSTYKQMALKTHPDKNPDNADATVQFQRVSEAYNVLLRHLDKSARPPRSHARAYNPYDEREYDSEGDDFSDEYDYYDDFDSEDDYYEEERMDFYMFLFEEMLRGRGGRSSQARFHMNCDCPAHRRQREQRVKESEESFQARLRQAREEQEIAEERRKREAAYRKAEQEKERAKERREAEKRQKEKATKKKAHVETSRKVAEDKAREQQRQRQVLRSSVFAAARNGDIAAVKNGIWQDAVDAAGGEVRNGCEIWIKSPPKDPRETLAHIVANAGESDLFEWLDTHGADQEERDSVGYTPFHVALAKGHISILRYVIDTHPPEDAEALYEQPPSKSNLQLALESQVPEAVWVVLDNKLSTAAEMENVWVQITSTAGHQGFFDAANVEKAEDKLGEIVNLLATFGNFSIDGLPEDTNKERNQPRSSPQPPRLDPADEQVEFVPRFENERPRRGKPYRQRHTAHRPSTSTGPMASTSPPESADNAVKPGLAYTEPRGRGRGRGGRSSRGRGGFQGRGRNNAPVS